jgi:hypothetical protein
VEVSSCCYHDDELSAVEGFRAALCNVCTWEGLQMRGLVGRLSGGLGGVGRGGTRR